MKQNPEKYTLKSPDQQRPHIKINTMIQQNEPINEQKKRNKKKKKKQKKNTHSQKHVQIHM